ncbi:MAG: DUF1800 family protein [Pseudomonadota bacterium]
MGNQFRRLGLVACVAASAVLAACTQSGGDSGGTGSGGGSGGGTGGPPANASVTQIDSQGEAATFLARAAFGGSMAQIDSLNGGDAANWVQSEFNKSPTFYLPTLIAREQLGEDLDQRAHSRLIWDSFVAGDDQLRQRMVFALSQIVVASDRESFVRPLTYAYYVDALVENAFGNYRDLLQDVTYSPYMSQYLTYFKNRKGDPNTGRMPDENYARELLQLFTIGLVELNMDGTPRLGPDNQPIETYTNDDIVGLARVFTGFSWKADRFDSNNGDDDAEYSALQSFADEHSELEKTFLGTTIPAGTGADESVTLALDHIFAHPNVAPFVSRQLIQRFTASNPDPAYVARVAAAFETGTFVSDNDITFGSGARGDLRATLAAVLLDASLYDGSTANQDDFGKIREPVLRFIHWARAFSVQNVNSGNERLLGDTSSPEDRIGQHPFRSPSVFNFYRPGYIAPNTETGQRDLTAPELQIVNASSTIGYINFLTDFIYEDTNQRDDTLETYKPDFSAEIALADNPAALTDRLDILLTGGRMSDDTKQQIIDTISLLPIEAGTEAEDRDRRVRLAALMAVNAPSFFVLR